MKIGIRLTEKFSKSKNLKNIINKIDLNHVFEIIANGKINEELIY